MDKARPMVFPRQGKIWLALNFSDIKAEKIKLWLNFKTTER